MRHYQLPLIHIDRLIKLGEVEKALADVFRPAISRPTIIAWIEEGTLDGKQIGRGGNWFVYESSLNKLILNCQPIRLAA